MSENKIVFNVDRTDVSEGENVMVAWDCGLPDAVTLTIDNGYSTSQIQLADSGSRMVAMHKSKGRTTLRLTVATGGKIERREVAVKVKNLKTTKTETASNSSYSYAQNKSRNKLSLKGLLGKVGYRIRSFFQRLSYGWRVMPKKTKRIYQCAFILMFAMWFNTCGQSKGYQMGYEQAMRDVDKAQEYARKNLVTPVATPVVTPVENIPFVPSAAVEAEGELGVEAATTR